MIKEKRIIEVDSCMNCPFRSYSPETHYRYGFDQCSKFKLDITKTIYDDVKPIHSDCKLVKK